MARGRGKRPAIALLSAVLMLCACGVRTDPRPPEDTAARAPGDFEVARLAGGIELSWERPTKTEDGGRLYDLSGFLVERAEGSNDFAPVASLAVTDNDRIRAQRTFHYLDESPPTGPLRYRVRAMHEDGQQGMASELLLVGDAAPARIEKQAAPEPTTDAEAPKVEAPLDDPYVTSPSEPPAEMQ
jgi:hypothetical protein